MCANSEQYDNVCREQFEKISQKMVAIDFALRGDEAGEHPGMVSRLKNIEAFVSNMVWMRKTMITSVITLCLTGTAAAVVWIIREIGTK